MSSHVLRLNWELSLMCRLDTLEEYQEENKSYCGCHINIPRSQVSPLNSSKSLATQSSSAYGNSEAGISFVGIGDWELLKNKRHYCGALITNQYTLLMPVICSWFEKFVFLFHSISPAMTHMSTLCNLFKNQFNTNHFITCSSRTWN